MIKRILLILLGVFVVAQFFRPDRATPVPDPANDMLVVTNAPTDIQQLVIGACYDCHSYKTQYPWYVNVTPVNFIMQSHIAEGREVLNFSVWNAYASTKAAGECGETIREGEMAPGYYAFMHQHGDLSATEKQRLVAWFAANVPGGEGGGGKGEEEDED
ncbi:MAG: heme-binding domain-containing protein [Flavobacteriales bacterium]